MSFNTDFNSIEELDAVLSQEFETAEEEPTEEQPEEEVEETVEEVEEEKQPEEPAEEPEKEEPVEPLKRTYTAQEKQNYAFNKMRIENKQLRESAEQNQKFLENLAKASGYTSVEDLMSNVTKRLEENEAKKQGISPEVYARLNQQQRDIEELRQREKQATFDNQVLKFRGVLDEVVNEHGFTKDDVKEMLDVLESEGYDLDRLVSEPNPKFIIKGAFGDKIFKAQKQKALQQEKRQESLDKSKIKSSVISNIDDEDAEIEKELKAYAREHNYYFE